jgi:hypothetical protein
LTTIHQVVGFQVSDDRLNRLASFEQPALFIGQPLVLATVFDLDVWVVIVKLLGVTVFAFETPLQVTAETGPNKSRSSIFLPALLH